MRDRVKSDATKEGDALMRTDVVRLATEVWVRKHPDWGVVRDGRWLPIESPRWLLGMAYGSFIEKHIREGLR